MRQLGRMDTASLLGIDSRTLASSLSRSGPSEWVQGAVEFALLSGEYPPAARLEERVGPWKMWGRHCGKPVGTQPDAGTGGDPTGHRGSDDRDRVTAGLASSGISESHFPMAPKCKFHLGFSLVFPLLPPLCNSLWHKRPYRNAAMLGFQV